MIRPSEGRDGENTHVIWVRSQTKIFSREGLDRANHVEFAKLIRLIMKCIVAPQSSLGRIFVGVDVACYSVRPN